MSENSTFTILYFAGLIAGSAIRLVYTRAYRKNMIRGSYETKLGALWAALPSLGMIVLPLAYALTPWLSFADYRLPVWAGWAGVATFAAALWLLWRSHADLGHNWSPRLEIVEAHGLVMRGVFRTIRHPMYASHLLWGIAQPLLLHNWIAGFAMLATLLPLYMYRVPREERMLVDQFGDAYRAYMKRTGRVLPRLGG